MESKPEKFLLPQRWKSFFSLHLIIEGNCVFQYGEDVFCAWHCHFGEKALSLQNFAYATIGNLICFFLLSNLKNVWLIRIKSETLNHAYFSWFDLGLDACLWRCFNVGILLSKTFFQNSPYLQKCVFIRLTPYCWQSCILQFCDIEKAFCRTIMYWKSRSTGFSSSSQVFTFGYRLLTATS